MANPATEALARRVWQALFDLLIRSAPIRTASLARRGLTPNDSRALFSLDPRTGRAMRSLAEEWQCDPGSSRRIGPGFPAAAAQRQACQAGRADPTGRENPHGSAAGVSSATGGIRPFGARRPRGTRPHRGQVDAHSIDIRTVAPALAWCSPPSLDLEERHCGCNAPTTSSLDN
jgi:hypothetical protein